MNIGTLAKAVGCQVETIRFYEKEGLIPAPERSAAGYRRYSPAHLEQLKFVVHCRSLDISLAEIKRLLQLKSSPEDDCGEINRLIDRHIGDLHRKIAELALLEQQLIALRDHCHDALSVRECGIMQGLIGAAAGEDCPCHDR